jgi:hypothetical protein
MYVHEWLLILLLVISFLVACLNFLVSLITIANAIEVEQSRKEGG